MKEIVIIGFGGFGREVAVLAKDCGYSVLGFLDDKATSHDDGAEVILGSIDQWGEFPNVKFVVAIGNPRTRKLVIDRMSRLGSPSFATLIHPSVIMSSSVSVGVGSVVCANCVFTVDIYVGEHTILNINVVTGHDVVIGSFVTAAHLVGISGNVVVETGVELGASSVIRQGITLKRGAMLGMGAVLTKDADENKVYVGSPAKVLKELSEFPVGV